MYGEVAGYELQHVALLGRWHQLLVDTYAAQHVGERTPRIGPAFALIGLQLALERGWDGPVVRDAHQALARAHRDWPPFLPAPRFQGGLTVADLALAGSSEAHVEILRAWAGDVWAGWADRQETVRALTAARLDGATAR
ncbi:MAG: serine/threonine protein kinase [Chloroflexi bacterium]|nr:MAG: serine/threonine protein kinase [Chloroflexota bacterium]